jgi:hypothetical protein
MNATERNIAERRLRELLASHAAVKLATSSPDANPWIATAYFSEESSFSLVFMIEGGGRTLRNMRHNPRVALMIEDGDALALFAQAEGRASVVEGAEDAFRDAIASKSPKSAPLVGLPGLVPVRITISKWRLTDVPRGWLPARELAA